MQHTALRVRIDLDCIFALLSSPVGQLDHFVKQMTWYHISCCERITLQLTALQAVSVIALDCIFVTVTFYYLSVHFLSTHVKSSKLLCRLILYSHLWDILALKIDDKAYCVSFAILSSSDRSLTHQI